MKKLYFVFLIFFMAPLFGQETIPIFNRIPPNEKGIEEINKLLSDPGIRIEDKQAAVDRLAVIVQQIYAQNPNFPPEKMYNPLIGALTPNPNEPHHHVLRINICRALGVFAIYEKGTENVIPVLGRRLKDVNEHEDVRIEAARSLGRFWKNTSMASIELVDALNIELQRGPQADNIRLVSAVIQSLGALGDKRSFVPLMKVIQSSFPTGIKKDAQASLESIKWD
ncbi:MAG: HEAT repeat domain-containing protein [Leptospiraceae bacterium]|nr:HEAT repeat domain-containing protein [Leptospiraceae bacterium]MDW7976678.1 HEAT repeat domain-containing protein [Leptospiraceae bacterium]